MSKIDEKLGEVIDKLTKLAEQHGGAAVDLAAEVVRVDSIQSLIFGAAGLLAAGGLAWVGSRFLKRGSATGWEPGIWILGSAVPAMVSFILAIVSAPKLADFWNWAGAFDPKLALAKNIMRAAGL